ncbi:ABC1 family protein [Stipitochalara longipes BDJ]|nr:ABC1 family protein [Stipitochalara longipes BDJ]
MKGFNFAMASAVARTVQRAVSTRAVWTCRRCLLQSRSIRTEDQVRAYARKSNAYGNGGSKHVKPKKRGRVIVAAAGGALGVTAVAFTDDVKHAYGAVERTGRVVSTLAVCINDYRVTLNQNEKTEDEEERNISLKACHQRCADRTLRVLEKNGSIFIKLGQHLSAMNYLLPLEWTTTFIPLQDKCPVSSFESIEAMFEQDTGEQLSDYFSEFEHQPIGAASLAQVHLATVKETGQKVAVKVQHPTLAEWAGLDLALTSFTFSTLKRFFPEYDLEWLSSEMEYSLPQELDFALEGQNALRAKEYFSHIPELPLVVPDVIWAKKRILVMENVSGHRPDDLKFLDANGIDRDEVSAALARIFNEMIFGTDAPLHCDPHGGNIAIRKNLNRRGCNFDVILYDHGLYRDIPIELRRSYAKLWLAVIDADEERMRKYAKEVAGITDEQFPLFASAITGRDYSVLKKNVAQARSLEEKKNINTALGEGMLQQLVQLLGQVPRIILLILKTNDLTRSLDENLQTKQGPVRTFLILARYCSRTVFEEQVEELRKRGSLLWPRNLVGLLGAWLGYFRVEAKLEAFELWLAVKRGWHDVVG